MINETSHLFKHNTLGYGHWIWTKGLSKIYILMLLYEYQFSSIDIL